MFFKSQDILQSLVKVQKNELLEKLIKQLNKDFNLSGIDFQIDENVSPQFIVNELVEVVSFLINNDFKKLMNLLYRIDISEKKFMEIEDVDIKIISQKVTFLILKKEWQKVWFRNKN